MKCGYFNGVDGFLIYNVKKLYFKGYQCIILFYRVEKLLKLNNI